MVQAMLKRWLKHNSFPDARLATFFAAQPRGARALKDRRFEQAASGVAAARILLLGRDPAISPGSIDK